MQGEIELSMTHSRELAQAVCVVDAMFEPLYTAEEMKARRPATTCDELMARAGRAVAEEAMRRFPDAQRFVAVCGGGANGGDGRIALEVLEAAGKAARTSEDAPVEEADVIIDALFGTGFHGEPREDAARAIEAINAAGTPVVAVDLPSGVNASTGEIAGAASSDRDGDDARAEGRPRGRAGPLPGRRGRRRRHRPRAARDRAPARHAGDPGRDPAPAAPTRTSTPPGTVLVVGGSRGLTGAALPRRRGCLPRRRGLRRGRRAGLARCPSSSSACSRR